MKSRFLWLFAVILGVVSCREEAGVDNALPPVAEKVRITASMEDVTRTSLGDNYEVLWSEDDVITLYGDYESSEFFLVEGAGTTTATFEGFLPASSAGVIRATYGYWWNTGNGYIENQNYVAGSFGTGYDMDLDLGAVPMVGTYNAETKSLAFKNVAGIVRVDIAGSGVLESLWLYDAMEENYLSGDFMFDFETLSIYDWYGGIYYTSVQNINVELTEEAQSFYVVCPPCTINELGVRMYFNDANDSVSVTASNPITIERGVITPLTPAITVEAPTWGVVGSFNGWDPTARLPMELLDNGYMLAAYNVELNEGDEFKFILGGTWDNENYGYDGADSVTAGYYYDACFYGGNIIVAETGIYDLYLDLINKRFYVMAAGEDWTNATSKYDYTTMYGVMGDLLNNNWTSDVVMEYAGDGKYVARNVVFANANGEGAVFKIRINEDWSTSLGVESVATLNSTNAAIAVSQSQSANINVDVIIGLGYDIWYDSINSEVWVMRQGVEPGNLPLEYVEYELPYMYGSVFYDDRGTGYSYMTQFILTDTDIYKGWTSAEVGTNFLFTIFFDSTTYPSTIILNDMTGSCLMSTDQICGYFNYVEFGQLESFAFFSSAVLYVDEDSVEVYATIGSDIIHIVYNGAPKLGFADTFQSGGATEKFVMLEEFNPEWK